MSVTTSPSPASSQLSFAQPLTGNVPIVFLPLRIETRFGTAASPELWIRAFPHDIAVDGFEAALTDDEQSARTAYLAAVSAAGTDQSAKLAAWAALAQRFGAQRAAWIASPAAASSGTKTSDWSSAPSTTLLPDRLIFCAYDATGAVIREAGAAITDGITLGPSPAGGDPASDPALHWMRDFEAAIALGLAIKLPISAAQRTSGFTRVLVYGVKSTLAPADGASRFAAALDAHHYTDGAEILPINTPTNNAEGLSSGYSSADPGFATSFATECGVPFVPSADGRADGERLANAFGIAATTFEHVRGASGRHDDASAAMNAVLWPATLGYYLANMVNAAVPDAADVMPAAAAHFAAWVRARGPWPTLRVGRQPYGVLPVLASSSYQALEGGPLAPHLAPLLAKMRASWESSTGAVAHATPGADPEATLTNILAMAPCSTSYAGRTALGPQFSAYYWPFVGAKFDASWFTTLAADSTKAFASAAATLGSTRLATTTFLQSHFSLSPSIVTAQPGAAPLDQNYLTALAGMTLAQLQTAAPPQTPAPLLWLLVRHAALRQYAQSAYELLGSAVTDAERVEPELIDLSPASTTSRVWDQFALSTTATGPVGAYLDQHKGNGPADFTAFWNALGKLAQLSSAELDSSLRESLDLCSYRLDAWFTSLATQRLDTIRRASGNAQTLYLGAYGWVEDLKPKTAPASWGYVHAPSLPHATAAAVLRSGYLSHRDDGDGGATIDLSSTRVRRALRVLDAVRDGQPLGAELGYQFERALHEAALDAYVAHFRALVSSSTVTGGPAVDGLALLRQSIPWNTAGFPAAGTSDYAALGAQLAVLGDTLDAVSDVMLAESVYQLAGGNPVRAGAAVDALGRGDAPPPQIDVVQTPQAGATITHRLLVFLADGAATAWPASARGLAEPRLEAYVAQLLGAPSRVLASANYLDASGATLGRTTLSLADTGLGALDVLALSGRPPGVAGQSEIEQRLARAAASKRPSTISTSASIVLNLDRDASWTPEQLSIDELLAAATAARALLATARAATAADFASPAAAADPAIDTAELQARADAAVARLTSVRAAFDAAGVALDVALDGASRLGASGAVPSPDPTGWAAQASLVKAMLDQQIAQLAALEAGFDRTGAAETVLRDHDLARLALVFGDSFCVVPALTTAAAATLGPLFAQSTALLAGDLTAPATYVARASRVRSGVAALTEPLLYAEALDAGASFAFEVAQLPAGATRWAGLPVTAAAPLASCVSLIASGNAGTARAALFVDEWLETVPNATLTTGLTFNVDDAKAQAPQTILLGVTADGATQWTVPAVEATLLDAIDLAHLRAVDPDTLSGVGHYLPALFLATNLASSPDAISTDLTLAAPAPAIHPIITLPIIAKLSETTT